MTTNSESTNIIYLSIDLEYKIYQVIVNKIYQHDLILLLFFKRFRFRDCLIRSRLWGLRWKISKDRILIYRVIRYRLGSWLKDVLRMRISEESIENRLINWIWSVRNYTKKWKLWKVGIMILIRVWSRSIGLKNNEQGV